MGIISVKEDSSQSSSQTTRTEKTATRVFIVRADSPISSIQAETATDGTRTIPVGLSPHPDDANRLARSITPSPAAESGRTVWSVKVDYSNKSGDTDFATSPLSKPADIKWDFSETEEPYFKDESDPPQICVNTAGEPFTEFLRRQTSDVVVTVTKNVATYSPAQAIQYRRAVNINAFSVDGVTILPNQARLNGIPASEWKTENGVRYRTVTYTFKLRDTWDDKIDSRGFNGYDIATGKLKEIIKGKPPVKPDQPWPLDGFGVAQPHVDDPAHQMVFKPYTPLAFNFNLA